MRQDIRAAGQPLTGRRLGSIRLVGLLVALFAASWLLTLPRPPADPARAGSSPTDPVSGGARIVRSDGRLSDGRAFTPLFYPAADTSVGTALTSDGSALRLLVRSSSGGARELMRLPAADNPQIRGLTAAGDDLAWMAAPGGSGARPVVYHANWRQPAPVTPLTADTGQVTFTGAGYDVVIADGQVHWAAAGANRTTEIRSVPVGGGGVSVRTIDGTYALSAWPWLSSAYSAVSGPIELRNPVTDQRIRVPRTSPEVVTCGPAWCRVLTPGPDGKVARTELMRPDGTSRIRVAAGATTSAITDVALLDRFEILTTTVPASEPDNLKLVLYDLTTNRSSVLAEAAGTVQGAGSIVWWSTGDDVVTWYALDLRTVR